MSGYKNPPPLGEDKPYDQWKNEISMWRLVTEVAKEKQALAVSLTLIGKAKEVALEIPADDLHVEAGMDTLLAKLDGVFERETVDRTYETYHDFESFSRIPEESIRDYIARFDRLNTKMKKFGMELPDAVLACKILKGASLSLKERQLVLAAANKLEYATMSSALKRIFGEQRSSSSLFEVKQEPVFYSVQANRNVASASGARTNPLRRDGSISQCAICNSTFHWWRNCPQRKNKQRGGVQRKKCTVCESIFHSEKLCPHRETESANIATSVHETGEEIVLVTKLNELEGLLEDSYGCAILDSACTRTVCGHAWLSCYLATLDDFEMGLISVIDSSAAFRFGDAERVPSLCSVVIPAQIAGKNVKVRCEVVDKKIPLLLSKESLKAAGAVIDFAAESVTMFDQVVNVARSKSGHFCVKIVPEGKRVLCDDQVLFTDELHRDKISYQKLEKLHRQFGHASFDRLSKLLKNAGADVDGKTLDLLRKVGDECKVCRLQKRPSVKPAVCMPLATEFNEVVAIDLHQLGTNLWYMHSIDLFTRLSAASIIGSKSANSIISELTYSSFGRSHLEHTTLPVSSKTRECFKITVLKSNKFGHLA